MIFRNCYTPWGEWNLRQFWNITSGVYAKQHVQIMVFFIYTTFRKSYLIFTCRYFKLSWNPTALSQSNCRNFSCSRITFFTSSQEKQDRILHQICLFLIKRVPWNCQNCHDTYGECCEPCSFWHVHILIHNITQVFCVFNIYIILLDHYYYHNIVALPLRDTARWNIHNDH